ncbi:MAG: pilus assembly protein N-terminal domain-containing protein [Hyphomicrobiales bacterium]
MGTRERHHTSWFTQRYVALLLAVIIAVPAGLGLAPAGANGKSNASDILLVPVDQVRIVRLNRDPSSVVVGNPLIADAVVQEGGIIIVVGKNYGTTNIIALDENGKELTHINVNVRTGGINAVSLFRGTGRVSYNCSPKCEAALDTGDDPVFFETLQRAIGNKVKLSNGAVQGK